MYTWTIQTYLRLKAAGTDCRLTAELPEAGIVLGHSNALRSVTVPPAPRRLVICMKAESPLSAIATIHIVQNPSEASVAGDRYFIPHWPQPQLIARDASRGDRFETVAFYGHQNSLAPELQSPAWQAALAKRGLTQRTISNTNPWHQHTTIDTRWNDYHDIDAVVAVRSFNPWQRQLTKNFSNKPATKLYNAWLSGVIPILGVESAYRQTGESGKNYVEANSLPSLLTALERLRSDVAGRRALLTRGQHCATQFTAESVIREWQAFLEKVAIPAYVGWCNLSSAQQKQAYRQARFNSLLNKAANRSRCALLKVLSD